MRQWSLVNDRIVDAGIDVPHLGVPYQHILEGKVDVLPNDYDGLFPFTRMCNSIGDWGIISGIFEAMKTKYPKIKLGVPSEDYLNTVLSPMNFKTWNYNKDWDTSHNLELIIKNNPYIDFRFNKEQFDIVYTDHDRAYDEIEEPLAEQIVKRFGFTNDDLSKIDLRPKMYFTDEEINISKHIVSENNMDWGDYGCLLLASRVDEYKSQWKGDDVVIPYIEKYKNTKVFCYSGWEVDGTFWNELFPNRTKFDDIPMRIQLCIKYFAKFNIGYQAGITDSITGGKSDIITITPYKSLKVNFVRGVQYVYLDGRTRKSNIYKLIEE